MYIKSVSFLLTTMYWPIKSDELTFLVRMLVFTFIKNTYLPLLVIFMINRYQNKTMDFII